MLKAKIGYDDALDAFGVHGIGETGVPLQQVFLPPLQSPCWRRWCLALRQHIPTMDTASDRVSVSWAFAAIMTFVILSNEYGDAA